MKTFEVSFNSPQCGYMSVGFSGGESEFHTVTANAPYKDVLQDLLLALANVMSDQDLNLERTVKWNRDPEEFDLVFNKVGEDLDFAVFQYPSVMREAKKRECVFRYTAGRREICAEFAEAFTRLKEDRVTDEFEFNWRQDFPEGELNVFLSTLNKQI